MFSRRPRQRHCLVLEGLGGVPRRFSMVRRAGSAPGDERAVASAIRDCCSIRVCERPWDGKPRPRGDLLPTGPRRQRHTRIHKICLRPGGRRKRLVADLAWCEGTHPARTRLVWSDPKRASARKGYTDCYGLKRIIRLIAFALSFVSPETKGPACRRAHLDGQATHAAARSGSADVTCSRILFQNHSDSTGSTATQFTPRTIRKIRFIRSIFSNLSF